MQERQDYYCCIDKNCVLLLGIVILPEAWYPTLSTLFSSTCQSVFCFLLDLKLNIWNIAVRISYFHGPLPDKHCQKS